MNKYIPGGGNANAKLMFVGEAPSYDEEQSGRPFTGPAGRLLDECCRTAKINRNDCWITNVFKYMIVPQVKKGKKIPAYVRAEMAGLNVQQNIQELRTEIDQIRPNIIVPLGGTALWAIFGKEDIGKYRGSILSGWNYKLVPTYHPASVLHEDEGRGNYWQKVIIEFDLKRALAQSHFPEIIRPTRNLIICRNSAQLAEFYSRGKALAKSLGHPIKLAVDIEALRCIPVCISLAFEITCGMCVPLWNTTSLCKISDISDSDLVSVWLMLQKILNDPDFLIVGQNFKYDQDKINKLGFTIPFLYSDTMLKAFACNPEFSVSLAFNTSIYTEEPYYKDEGLEFDYTKNPIDDLLYYGAKDAPVTLEIDNAQEQDLIDLKQVDFYYNFIMKLHSLYLDIENTGMRVDEERRANLLRKYIAWSERLSYELFMDTGEQLNVNSYKQVDKLLYEILSIPRREGTGEEVLTRLLANVVKDERKRRIITNILTKRRVEKTSDNYCMALPDYDGRMKTSYFLCLKTGRTSTGLLEPPIRPAEDYRDFEKKKKKKHIGSAFQVMTKHGDIGADVREMYVPDKGEVFVNVDSSQAEARVVTLLANDEVMLKLYDTNDVHALTASWFFGGEEVTYSKKVLGYEHPIRFVGKTLRHAGHLGAKKARAATEVNTQARKYNIDISVDEKFCDVALKIFHRKCPAIQGVFHKGVIDAINKTRRLIAPLPYGIESKYGGARTFYERYGDDLFREAFSYLPQRAISDNTKAAALRIKKIIKEIKIVIESHDSLLFSVPENRVDDFVPIFKEEMERPIKFENCSIPRRDLVIPADIEIGYNYADLKKYRKEKVA